MKTAPLLLAMLIHTTMLWRRSGTITEVYIYENNLRMQNMLVALSRELVWDAESKIKAVQHYRDQYYKSLQYQLGDLVYELRDYFKRMVRMFIHTERNVSYAPSDNHNANIRTYVEIRRMATEVDIKVALIREWQTRRAPPAELHSEMREPLRSGAGRLSDESQELLHESVVRGRMAREGRARRPLPRRVTPAARVGAPSDGAKRKNNKWRYARG